MPDDPAPLCCDDFALSLPGSSLNRHCCGLCHGRHVLTHQRPPARRGAPPSRLRATLCCVVTSALAQASVAKQRRIWAQVARLARHRRRQACTPHEAPRPPAPWPVAGEVLAPALPGPVE